MTIPPYNPQIPQSTDTFADSQKGFLNNFSTLFTDFAQNHVSLNALTDPGNHNAIQLLEQKVPRSTLFQEISIYSKKVPDQSNQIFMRYQLNGKEFQLTEYQIFALPILKREDVIWQIPFFSFLPGGIIVYFGKFLTAANTPFINLNPGICSNIFSINLCPIGGVNASLPQSSVSLINNAGKFTFIQLHSTDGPPVDQYYLAFGNI